MGLVSSGTKGASLSGSSKIPLGGAAGLVTDGDQILTRLPTSREYTDSATLELADGQKTIFANKATAMSITVPPNASVALPVNQLIPVMASGVGEVTIAAGAGVTINSTRGGSLILPFRFTLCYLYQISANSWILLNGDPPIWIPMVINAGTTANLSSGAHPNTPQDIGGASLGPDHRKWFDASYAKRMYLAGNIDTASASPNNPRLYPSYSLDNGSNFSDVGDTTSAGQIISAFTGGVAPSKKTDIFTLPDAAKANVLWRVTQNGGNSSATFTMSHLVLYFEIG